MAFIRLTLSVDPRNGRFDLETAESMEYTTARLLNTNRIDYLSISPECETLVHLTDGTVWYVEESFQSIETALGAIYVPSV